MEEGRELANLFCEENKLFRMLDNSSQTISLPFPEQEPQIERF